MLLKAELSKDSTNTALKIELADCLVQMEQNDSALRVYARLENAEPDNLSYQIKQFAILYKINDYEGCIAKGRQIIQADSIPRVLSLMGDSFAKMEKRDSATYYYEKVLGCQPLNWRALDKASDIYFKTKNHDAVLSLTKKFLQLEPDNRYVRQIQGLAYYLQGKYRESLDEFLQLLVSGVDTDVVHYYVGMNYYYLMKYRNALKEFETLYLNKDDDVNLITCLAYSRSNTGSDYETEVKPLFEKAISLMQPDSAKMFGIFSKYGNAALKNFYYKDAIAAYREAYKYDSSYNDALIFMAHAYESQDNYKAALSCYNNYLSKEKNLTEAKKNFIQSRIDHLKQELFMAGE